MTERMVCPHGFRSDSAQSLNSSVSDGSKDTESIAFTDDLWLNSEVDDASDTYSAFEAEDAGISGIDTALVDAGSDNDGIGPPMQALIAPIPSATAKALTTTILAPQANMSIMSTTIEAEASEDEAFDGYV